MKMTIDVQHWTPEEVASLVALVQSHEAGYDEEDPPEEYLPAPVEVEEAPDTGWTKEAVTALLAQLARNGRAAQADVLSKAVERGGFIARSEVYHVAKYPSKRRLNGFTTPINTARDQLVRRGELAPGAVDVLTPEYGEGTGFRPALGFNVAPEVLRAFQA